MEPILIDKPMNEPEFIYQVKWDGVRMIAGVEDGKVILINKHQHIRTMQYPELHNISDYLSASRVVLDGEVIALHQGKPSFHSVMRRDSSRTQESIEYLKRLVPVTYMVFDLLLIDGKSLLNETLTTRSNKLYKILTNGENFHLVEDFNNGSELYDATRTMQLEGIVAKKITSSYHSGKKHQDWFKIKHHQSITCTVGGYTTRNNMINSLLLGLPEDDKLIYIGKAAAGLTTLHLQILTEQLPHLTIKESPFVNLCTRSYAINFVQPVLQVMVEFLEWTEQGRLRSPVIKGFVTGTSRKITLL